MITQLVAKDKQIVELNEKIGQLSSRGGNIAPSGMAQPTM
jgi:hypothetical protein